MPIPPSAGRSSHDWGSGVGSKAGPRRPHAGANERADDATNYDLADVTRRVVKISQEANCPSTEIGFDMFIPSDRNFSETASFAAIFASLFPTAGAPVVGAHGFMPTRDLLEVRRGCAQILRLFASSAMRKPIRKHITSATKTGARPGLRPDRRQNTEQRKRPTTTNFSHLYSRLYIN